MLVETFATFNRDALVALQARDIPRVRAADYFEKIDKAQTAEEATALDEDLARWDAYLAEFAKLTDGRCLCCGESLRCPLGMGLFGGFEWGLAHGEGRCVHCHYPMRGIHRVDGLGTIRNLLLPYHPSALSFSLKETP
jgi:hypothetical protein